MMYNSKKGCELETKELSWVCDFQLGLSEKLKKNIADTIDVISRGVRLWRSPVPIGKRPQWLCPCATRFKSRGILPQPSC